MPADEICSPFNFQSLLPRDCLTIHNPITDEYHSEKIDHVCEAQAMRTEPFSHFFIYPDKKLLQFDTNLGKILVLEIPLMEDL